jgi:hypothetical protein
MLTRTKEDAAAGTRGARPAAAKPAIPTGQVIAVPNRRLRAWGHKMMNLDDLRRLDPKQIGSWPVLPKLGVLLLTFAVIITGSYFLDWQDQIEAIDAAKRTELALRDTFIEKKKQALNLDAYRQQTVGDRKGIL